MDKKKGKKQVEAPVESSEENQDAEQQSSEGHGTDSQEESE